MPAEPGTTAPQALSLYLHAPYCRSRCRYCAFASQALPGDPDWAAHAEALAREAALWGRRLGRPRVATVFYGGGTPSLIPSRHLANIFAALRDSFHIAPEAEITCEANPESATPEFLAAARACGVNRLSLGAQSLDDHMLRLLGRVHDARDVRRAVEDARALSGEGGGFDNLGLDLIWGLPGQTPEHWLDTLRAAISLEPEHLSCYGLSLEPGTPLAAALSTLPPLPSEDALERMYLDGGDLLDAAGYRQYEVSNFARTHHNCRHNSLTWTGAPYLGLGPAAVSTLTLPGPCGPRTLRWTNPEDPAQWAVAVTLAARSGEIGPPPGHEELDAQTLRQERLMLALRTSQGAPLDAFTQRQGLVEQLLATGLAQHDHHSLTLTRRGLLVSSSVIEALVFG